MSIQQTKSKAPMTIAQINLTVTADLLPKEFHDNFTETELIDLVFRWMGTQGKDFSMRILDCELDQFEEF